MPKKKKKVVSTTLKSRNVHTQVKKDKKGMFNVTTISQVERPEGKRFFGGRGKSKLLNMAQSKAGLDMIKRATLNPSDSLSTKKVTQFLKERTAKQKMRNPTDRVFQKGKWFDGI